MYDIGGGIQHASFKHSLLKLRKKKSFIFWEILNDNKQNELLDASSNYNRLKQYQIGKYLAGVDNGWVLRKGRYYRGDIQSEDEEVWGKAFFETLLKNDSIISKHYYLIRQAFKDIPHNGDNNPAQLMRSVSKTISEDIPSFMDISIKYTANQSLLISNWLKIMKTRIMRSFQ